MPELSWNSDIWGGEYDWTGGGEEWSEAWGGSEAQWFGSLLPRLHRTLPARAIIEIAPGFGRWTRFLLPASKTFLGIDLSAACIAACEGRFGGAKHARFVQNDGFSLAAAADGSCDFVFSFDSLVHAELDVLEAYVPQILRKLRGNGTAFIHHSNVAALPADTPNIHRRAASVSADAVAQLVGAAGGAVLIQENINWGGEAMHDCLTLFGRAAAFSGAQPVRVDNPRFMDEAAVVRAGQSPWSGIPVAVGGPAAGGLLGRLRRAVLGDR